MATVYAIKFNINELIHDSTPDKVEEFLKNLFEKLNQNVVIKDLADHEIKYKFVNLEKDFDNFVITGRIIKFYDGINYIYIEEIDDLRDEQTSNKAEFITFSFDFKTEIIGIVPKVGFSKEAFLEYFKILVENIYPEMGKIKLVLVPDAGELDEKFKKLDILKEIQIDLVPENNIDNNDFGRMIELLDDKLSDSNAQQMSVNLKGTKKNPLKKTAELVNDFKQITKRAYARLRAKGYKEDGQEYTIDSSRDVLLRKTISNHNKDSMPIVKEMTTALAKEYVIQKRREARNDNRGEE